MRLRVPEESLLVYRSPATVVTFRAPLLTLYLVASSRTIPFHLVLSSDVPLKSSPGLEPPALAPSTVTQTNFAVAVVAAALDRANRPILALAGSAAVWPTLVQVVPSGEVSPVMLVPSDLMRM